MNRTRLIAVFVLLVVIAFLLGFVPQWMHARGLEDDLEETRVALQQELEETRFELEMARLEGLLGAALAEAQRTNYERARQLLAEFYPRLQENIGQVEDPARQQTLRAILNQRDEMITLLSRAEPESTERLMLLFTRYFSAVDPAGRATPATVTPSPPS